MSWTGELVRLFAGDDWAEDHHDVELMDAAGRVLAKKRLPGGVAGMARLHELIGLQLGEYKVLARTHKTLIWERTRAVLRLRHQLREYFPAALEAFDDLDAADTLELLGKAPDPARAAGLTRAQVSAALKRGRRRGIPDKATAIAAALRSDQRGRPAAVTAAYAVTARSLIAVITTLNKQVKVLQGQVEAHCGQHPDAEIYLSQPGLGAIPGARVLGEFGDDPHRYADGKSRKNYAATSPITRAPGKKKVVAARFIHNARLIDALRRLANRLAGILHGCLKTRSLYDETTAWSHRASELAA